MKSNMAVEVVLSRLGEKVCESHKLAEERFIVTKVQDDVKQNIEG